MYINLLKQFHVLIFFCSGQLLLWDLSKEGKEQCQTFGLGHSRIVFNISCDVAGTRIMTVSMDRQVKSAHQDDHAFKNNKFSNVTNC